MRPIALILLATVVSIIAFSMPLAIHAQHSEGGAPMEHCPFMTHTDTLCPMTFVAHLAAWQSLIAHTPLSLVATMLLLSVLIALLCNRNAAFIHTLTLVEPRRRIRSHPPHEHPTSLHQLLPLFSRGILNPKLF
jgi:hypothetical protein